MKNNEWQEFFDIYAKEYETEVFTKNTLNEVDFIIRELKLNPPLKILDAGCGIGRHSIELAKRGFQVTGIDISLSMLKEAERNAGKAGVSIELIRTDARTFKKELEYDAAICLCEGAFSLHGSSDDPLMSDLVILKNIHSSLKPKAFFLLNALNAMRHIRHYGNADVESGAFNPLTLSERSRMKYKLPSGEIDITGYERGYVLTELNLLMNIAGFNVLNVWGGTAGSWNKQMIDLDEIELMVLAEKADINEKRKIFFPD
ncbi:MAG: methyltransferase domain-containing protein [Candidatus Coatesbacteria bacterium]|nr:methyltransferase domain-containing protein [Candidatus Coatesbacteria bacterium]